MAFHKKEQLSEPAARHRKSSAFEGRELHPDAILADLREKHDSGSLSHAQSLMLMRAGNYEHVARLKKLGITPVSRYERIKEGQLDYLVIACSDSRVHRLDSEESASVGIQIRVAGNVVPKSGTPSFDEMKEAVSRIRKDGMVLIEGHVHCGAVKERAKWVEGGMKPTGSESLDALLHEVFGTSPDDNALAQLTKARETLGLGSRPSAALCYDWEDSHVRVVKSNYSADIDNLVVQWNKAHRKAAAEEGTWERLRQQKPHAIAVAADDLPYSVATILHARQNEVFCTTGSAKGLDAMDEASILYALGHLGVKHITFIAPGTATDDSAISSMFDSWKKRLYGNRSIAGMLDSGEVVISRFRYDLSTGKIVAVA